MDRGDLRPNQGSTALGGAFRPVPRTGVIFVTEEATRARLPARPPRLVQPRPGAAGDRRRCPARRRASRRWPSTRATRSTRRWRACPSCARRWPTSTTAPTAAACARSTAAENVCIAGGGRAALTRAAAALGQINLGHFLPDYTAYEELLDIFRAFLPIPILLDAERGYAFAADELRREILGRGLCGVLMLEPLQPHRPAGVGRRARRLGGDRPRARLRAAHRRVLLPLRVGGRARRRWRARRATSRTSTATRW